MQGTAKWIASGIVGLIGMVGPFVGANAADLGLHVFGLGLTAFAIIYVSAQLKQSFDAAERAISRNESAAFGSRGGLVQ